MATGERSVTTTVMQPNAEGCREGKAILQLVKDWSPRLIFLQEVFPTDLAQLEEGGWNCVFLPMIRFIEPDIHNRIESKGQWGVAIASKEPIIRSTYLRYGGARVMTQPTYSCTESWNPTYAVLFATISFGGIPLRVATTHFPVSLNGEPDEQQRKLLPVVIKALQMEEVALFGADLNIPLTGELGGIIQGEFKLAPYPPETVSTLTPLHRKHPRPPLIVDYILTAQTSNVEFGQIQLNDAVSDHTAMFCTARVRL